MARRISQKRSKKPHIEKKSCRVRSVYDGDTITVEWENSSWFRLKRDVHAVKVRLAYIDTPELRSKEAGASQAKEFLEKRLTGKYVVLEYEQLPAGGPRKGDYNRMLAVIHLQRVFLPNLNINKFLIKKGLARLYSNPDNITPHHFKSLIRAEHRAKRRKIGIWQHAREHDRAKRSGVFWYVLIGIVIGILIGLSLVD